MKVQYEVWWWIRSLLVQLQCNFADKCALLCLWGSDRCLPEDDCYDADDDMSMYACAWRGGGVGAKLHLQSSHTFTNKQEIQLQIHNKYNHQSTRNINENKVYVCALQCA